MPSTSAVLATVAVAASAHLSESQYQQEFTTFVKKYNKQYPIDEVFGRYVTFKANHATIAEHNAAGHSWTMAINEFSDLTADEFKATYMGLNAIDNEYTRSQNTVNFSDAEIEAAVGADIDWSQKGAVTPVKNQGQCGSCWAFSTTGSIEGASQIASGNLVSLSEQQLVDCAGSSGNMGCNGGLMDNAFNWIIQNGGLCGESDYAYTARTGSCKKTCSPVTKISGFKDVPKGESNLAAALQQGPVSIAIEADQISFQHYSSGVMDGLCGQRLDHGVLLVGSGSDSGKDYWKVKNSWGASWGEAGYIRLIQGKDQCGLANQASYPTA